MEIKLSYPEMSFLRDLVNAEKIKIWRNKWMRELNYLSIKEINEKIDEIFKNPIYVDTNKEAPLLTNEQCIGRLLYKFDIMERTIQENLKKKI